MTFSLKWLQSAKRRFKNVVFLTEKNIYEMNIREGTHPEDMPYDFAQINRARWGAVGFAVTQVVGDEEGWWSIDMRTVGTRGWPYTPRNVKRFTDRDAAIMATVHMYRHGWPEGEMTAPDAVANKWESDDDDTSAVSQE